MTFKAGQSGNPSGGRSEMLWRQALLMALKRPKDKHYRFEDLPRIDQLAERQIELAYASDNPQAALTAIADRLDGKPAQSVIHGGDGSEINVKTTVAQVIVDPKDAG
jgi:hypothetical protein